MDKKDPICPSCEFLKSHIHDYRKPEIKDIHAFSYITVLVLNKRRCKCVNCFKRHYEETSFLGKYQRMTNIKEVNNVYYREIQRTKKLKKYFYRT